MFHYCSDATHTVYNTTVFINGEENGVKDWKDKLVSIIQKVPQEADELKPLVQLLVSAVAPAQIYLLRHKSLEGNRADDYLDLLLIMPNRCSTPFSELEPVLEMAYLKNKKVCSSLHQYGHVKDGLLKGHLFYSLACRKENLIYDSKELALPLPLPGTRDKLKANVRDCFSGYYQKAEHFYACACRLKEEASPLTAFMLQQAAEMTFRGILLTLNGYDKKTHELRCLKKHARRCAPQLLSVFPDDTEEESRLLKVLDDAYLGARYEPNFSVSEQDTEILSLRVKQLMERAISVVEKTIESGL